MGPNLKLTIQDTVAENDYQLVTFDGEFDKAGHMEVHPTLEVCVNAFEKKFLVFDFTALRFINSEGIGYLMEIHAHLSKRDKKLVVVGLVDHVQDVFQTIGISEIIPLYKDLQAFLNRPKV